MSPGRRRHWTSSHLDVEMYGRRATGRRVLLDVELLDVELQWTSKPGRRVDVEVTWTSNYMDVELHGRRNTSRPNHVFFAV